MTELYHASSGTSETTESATGPAHDTGEYSDHARYESAPDGDHGQDHGDTGAQATLADEDHLPTRQDARAATWGEDPEYYDENDPDAGYDGDLDTPTAADGDQLPTRQDSRAATWGDNPEYDDENDTGTEYDGDLGTFTSDDYALDDDNGDLDQGPADHLAVAAERPDDLPAQTSDSRSSVAAEQEERSPAHASERITELEAENAQLGRSITHLQARLERLEHANQAADRTPFVSSRGVRHCPARCH